MSDRQANDEREDRWNGNNRRKWTVKREIPVATVIALLVALMPIAGAGINLYTRVSLLEQEQRQEQQANSSQDKDRARIRSDIKDELRDINRKIDLLTQRLLDGGVYRNGSS